MLLEFDAKVGGVGRVFLVLTEGGRGAVDEVDGRVVFRDEVIGGIFGDERLETVAGGEEGFE